MARCGLSPYNGRHARQERAFPLSGFRVLEGVHSYLLLRPERGYSGGPAFTAGPWGQRRMQLSGCHLPNSISCSKGSSS